MKRFVNHICEANCWIEELYGDEGPEFAIVASRTIEPGKAIATSYGTDQSFHRTCVSSQCVAKIRHDPPVEEEVNLDYVAVIELNRWDNLKSSIVDVS
ncbi:SET domain-containing protein [Phytophthora infestans]|uniref:SET domain-containing protein n=1 Tax=Phytophthora infestans TaxID=4787 RepID=A0A8S9UW58_PHYIN|nr:SET domain-containing protein [Phytophthora infestans]